jgi:hypothetical protein
MPDATRHPVLYKLRYTPVLDFLRIGFTARLDLNRPLETAALPLPIKQLIERVVRRTRLWRLEKLDVLTELIGHFTDGIAAGISAEALVEAFGDEASAAKLIRRAKRRNRPLYWQALRFASQSLAVVLAIYGGLALYFFSGRPSPRTNYVAILNETSLKTPEADRAFPIYRRALRDFGTRRNRPWVSIYRFQPAAQGWPALLDLVRQHPAEVERIREGAAKPVLGFVFGVDRSAYNDGPLPCPLPAADPAAGLGLRGDLGDIPIGETRDVAAVLAADAFLAREARDGRRLLRDIEALLGLSKQVAQMPFGLADVISMTVTASALDEMERTLRQQPELFREEDWIALAHRISAPQVAGDLLSLDGARMEFDDILQRTFTDDGSGGGRLTPGGASYFQCNFSLYDTESIWVKPALHPVTGLLTTSRQTLSDEHARLIHRTTANWAVPAREANWPDDRETLNGSSWSMEEGIRAFLAFPYHTQFLQQPVERHLGRRDGLLVGIVLELQRRQRGKYPDSLDVLVPQFLPKVPADRVTGDPVRFRIVDGRPLIYSVGADRDDDGGRQATRIDAEGLPVPDEIASTPWGRNLQTTPDGDWVLYPTLK